MQLKKSLHRMQAGAFETVKSMSILVWICLWSQLTQVLVPSCLGSARSLSACQQANEDGREGSHRQERNRNEAEPIEIVPVARHARLARHESSEGRIPDFKVVVEGDQEPRGSQRKSVFGDAPVPFVYRDAENDGQRIHGDALVPAEVARNEPFDLAEVQAAERRDEGDHPSEIKAVTRPEAFDRLLFFFTPYHAVSVTPWGRLGSFARGLDLSLEIVVIFEADQLAVQEQRRSALHAGLGGQGIMLLDPVRVDAALNLRQHLVVIDVELRILGDLHQLLRRRPCGVLVFLIGIKSIIISPESVRLLRPDRFSGFGGRTGILADESVVGEIKSCFARVDEILLKLRLVRFRERLAARTFVIAEFHNLDRSVRAAQSRQVGIIEVIRLGLVVDAQNDEDSYRHYGEGKPDQRPVAAFFLVRIDVGFAALALVPVPALVGGGFAQKGVQPFCDPLNRIVHDLG
ncbi:hypothetical protein BN871_DN_00030 [Paenibacillus sp. P22]|nr:hypothetical protein BN871_DN_00030 [Paenibacillus sp. P22]